MSLSDTELAMLKKLCLYVGKDENEICANELYREFVAVGGWDWPEMSRFLVENNYVFAFPSDNDVDWSEGTFRPPADWPQSAVVYRVSSGVLNVVREAERIKINGEAAPSPEWVTRKRLHDIAKELSPAAAPKTKSFQTLPGFTKVSGKKDHIADYQELLPVLRKKWPEIPWPSQVSDWD